MKLLPNSPAAIATLRFTAGGAAEAKKRKIL
jgi:hypothetical protein